MICSPCPNETTRRSIRDLKRKSATQKRKRSHEDFVPMIHVIRRHASISFRKKRPEEKAELIGECIANAFKTYARLIELGKNDIIYPTVLAKFAVRQVRDGRRVGGRQKCTDILSRYAQIRKHIKIERLNHYDSDNEDWVDALIEDSITPVPEQVAFRMDFPVFLRKQQPPKRKVAEVLALGYTTAEAAKRFDVSSARISQLRREFEKSWIEFQGEGATAEEETLAMA